MNSTTLPPDIDRNCFGETFSNNTLLKGGCPLEVDGPFCWPPRLVGDTAILACPPYLPMGETVNRTCLDDGVWSEVDYTACGNDEEKLRLIHQEQDYLKIFFDLKKKCLQTNVTNDTQDGCPVVFDLYASCWESTPPGETANVTCPSFVFGWDRTRYAFRKCQENGTWIPRANYATCVDTEDLEFRLFVNRLYIVGYSVSVFALVISLTVFLAFRSLKCTRISIHVQLFFSLAINNILWLIWYVFIVDPDVVRNNGLFCRGLHVFVQYTMLATYAWMFCEALHLHLALKVVFFRNKLIWRYFLTLGWCVPALITMVYCILRVYLPKDSVRCWMFEGDSNWILTVPVLGTLIASTFFLANVLCVLVGKVSLPAPALRKGVRAAFLLVPLFGLQFIFLPYRPHPGGPEEHIYQVFSAIVVAPQGLCISFLFCFLNVDVHATVLSWLSRWFPVLGSHSEGLTGAAAMGVQHPTTRHSVL